MARPAVAPEVRYEAKVDRSAGPDACHPWMGGLNRHGYGRMRIGGRGAAQVDTIHRWAYQRFVDTLRPDEVVRHTCDVPSCQNPKHWRKGSQAENVQDMVDRARSRRGQDQPNSKLTNDQAAYIKTSVEEGKMLAKRFGVSQSTVSDIRHGKRWRWLK